MIIAILVCVIGLVIFLTAPDSQQRIVTVGQIMFAAGLLAFLLRTADPALALLK